MVVVGRMRGRKGGEGGREDRCGVGVGVRVEGIQRGVGRAGRVGGGAGRREGGGLLVRGDGRVCV